MSIKNFDLLQSPTYFFINVRALTYFCYFAIKINNISDAYQYSIMLNTLFEQNFKQLKSIFLDESDIMNRSGTECNLY